MSTDVPVVPPNTPKELQQRIEAAAKVMGIPIEHVLVHLSELGITNDEEGISLLDADTTTEVDAKAIFVEGRALGGTNGIIPFLVKIARFKAGWAILKGKSQELPSEKAGVEQLLEALKPSEQAPDEKLLEKYGPDCAESVFDQLKKRSKGRPFIIFDEDKGENKVDIPSSVNLLRIARRQDTPSTFLVDRVGGQKMVRPYAVGEFPNVWFEECPIHGDVILADGYCEKCQQSWKGVFQDDRVIVRVAKTAGVIREGYQDIHDLIEGLQKGFAATGLMKLPLVQKTYSELEEDNNLPRLRRKISRGKSDPFGSHRTY